MINVEKSNYDMLLEQINESFKHETNLLSACGLCVLMDVLAQEYYLNMKVRPDLGLPPYPNPLTSEQVAEARAEFEARKRSGARVGMVGKFLDWILRRKRPKFIGNKKIFLWAFKNMELILEDKGQPKPYKFTHANAERLYAFRCDMLHELGSSRFSLGNHPRENGERSRNLSDLLAKPIVEVQGDKILIRLPDLFQYLSEVIARLTLQAAFNEENVWLNLSQFITTSELFVDDPGPGQSFQNEG